MTRVDSDQDGDGTIDACDSDDDNDGIPDEYDVDTTSGSDCDANGEDDSCQTDTDGDGVIDPCDPMMTATAFLTNAMSTPPADLTVIKTVKTILAKKTPMATELLTPVTQIAMVTGMVFLCECDADETKGPDCDGNGVLDSCQPDSDDDGLIDACDPDDDNDGVPDECDVDATGGL